MARSTAPDPLQQLKQDIRAKSPARCYVFWGEETYLLRHYCQQLYKALIDPVTEEFNFHRMNQETYSTDTLIDSVEALPMMAEHTMVQVDEIDLFRLPEGERERVCALLEDLPDYCCLVFTYETTPYKPDKRQKRLYEALERSASCVEFAKQSPRELAAWISRHFLSYGKHISPDLCSYLVEITGGTMTALGSEIPKIAAYAIDDQIRQSDIDAVTEPVLDAVVFQLSDAIGGGDYALALAKLQTLLKMQQEPIAILGAIGAQLRRISAARTLLDRGQGADALMRLAGLKDYPARKTMALAKRFPAGLCRTALLLCVETDWKMKTSFDSSQRLLELLILRLAQEVKHG